MEPKKLLIDGVEIYIENLDYFSSPEIEHDSGIIDDGIIQWTTKQLQNALKPAASILNSLHEATKDIAPDEMELSMQFEMGISGNTPVLKIVSAESNFQLAAKFVWRKGNETAT